MVFSPESASRTTSTRSAPARSRDGAKETIESVIVAFILAFVFRAFVVEAFVIPTGSMAPTLYGKHGTMTCKNCGWEYAYGLTDPESGRPRTIRPESRSACPNCAFPNMTSEFYDAAAIPSIESGDRILVLKWPSDVGGEFFSPARWDVTVFKNPRDGEENFIKRLVGLPGDVLEIIDGDLYTVRSDRLSAATREHLDQRIRLKYLLWRRHEIASRSGRGVGARLGRPGWPGYSAEARQLQAQIDELEMSLAPTEPAVVDELNSALEIARKSRHAQDALWSVVYDADYPPRDKVRDSMDRIVSRLWEAVPGGASQWELQGRRFVFRGESDAEDAIELAGPPIDDFSGYNLSEGQPSGGSPNFVSDLRLRCVLTWHRGDGHVRFSLAKRGLTFWATVKPTGDVSLRVARGQDFDNATPLAEARIPRLVDGGPIEVVFENVDYRAALFVRGKRVLDESWLRHGSRTASALRGDIWPTVAEIRAEPVRDPDDPPRIAAQGLDVDLTHVVVERDVYYTEPSLDAGSANRYKLGPWGTVNRPILLRDREYFVLGDNSPQSADSRLWVEVGPHLEARGEAYQLGTVPADQMIGRAFFVYWPSGLRTNLIPSDTLRQAGLIPNVGRMRWIR